MKRILKMFLVVQFYILRIIYTELKQRKLMKIVDRELEDFYTVRREKTL